MATQALYGFVGCSREKSFYVYNLPLTHQYLSRSHGTGLSVTLKASAASPNATPTAQTALQPP